MQWRLYKPRIFIEFCISPFFAKTQNPQELQRTRTLLVTIRILKIASHKAAQSFTKFCISPGANTRGITVIPVEMEEERIL